MKEPKILVIEDNKLDFIRIHNVLNEYLENLCIIPNIPSSSDQTWEELIDKIQLESTKNFESVLTEKEFENINLFIVDISLLGGNDDKTGLDFLKFIEDNITKTDNVNYILVSKGSKLTGFKSKWYPDLFDTNFVDKEYEGKYYGEKLIKKIIKLWNLKSN